MTSFSGCLSKFQSTLSVRRATGTTGKLGEITIKFQSTLSVRRATWPVSDSAG